MPDFRQLSSRIRFAVLKRDGFRCAYCGAAAPEVRLHVDHVVARAHGGTDDAGNLVTACAQCNGGKSDGHLDSLETCRDRADLLELLVTVADECSFGTALTLLAGYFDGAYQHTAHSDRIAARRISFWQRHTGVVAAAFDACWDQPERQLAALQALAGEGSTDPLLLAVLEHLRSVVERPDEGGA